MSDSFSAHIKLIHCNYIFGEIITNTCINSKLSANRLFGSQQISDLYIELLSLLFTDKVNFLFRNFSDSHRISAPQQLHKNYIFQDQIDVLPVSAKNSLSNSMICHIVLFIYCQNFLPL